MESLSDDVLSLVLGRVSNGRDRKSCSEVCTLWSRIEALTRTHICVHDPRRLPHTLPRFPNLTTLAASSRVSDQSLMFIGQFCPNLRTLELASSATSKFRRPFGDDGLVAVAKGCRRLVEVSLSSTEVGDKGIVALQTYTKALSVLHLLYSSITDASLAAIGDMESLSDLHLEDCENITDSGLNLLSSGPASRSLRVLTIRNCDEITDVGFLHLRRMSSLEELDLSWCADITDVGGVAAVSTFTSLKKLDLSWQEFVTDETLFAVARGCHNLVDIKLIGCREITDRGLISLASSLPLERIDMSYVKGCRERSPCTVMQIAKGCRSLKHMIVDKELKKGLSRSQLKKLSRSSCRVEWI